jgi:hypothetical protein
MLRGSLEEVQAIDVILVQPVAVPTRRLLFDFGTRPEATGRIGRSGAIPEVDLDRAHVACRRQTKKAAYSRLNCKALS